MRRTDGSKKGRKAPSLVKIHAEGRLTDWGMRPSRATMGRNRLWMITRVPQFFFPPWLPVVVEFLPEIGPAVRRPGDFFRS
jgi:hypothetical protein